MQNTTQKITPHLWFDDQAEEAARFYTSLFDESGVENITRYPDAGQEIHGQEAGSVMTVDFELHGQRFAALNGGPAFTFTPAISFWVTCETEAEVDRLWRQLSDGGAALMELESYPWSERYGWVADRYGVTWQISLGDVEDADRKIVPCLTYVSEQGQAEDAIGLYTSIFDDSAVVEMLRYGPEGPQPEGTVMHARFQLDGQAFRAMDSSPELADFTFNEAVSLLVDCETQDEIDYFWERLSEGGDEEAKQCGWLKDRFGVSWQVFPSLLMNRLLEKDEATERRVTDAMLQMKKIDVGGLKAAAAGRNS